MSENNEVEIDWDDWMLTYACVVADAIFESVVSDIEGPVEQRLPEEMD